VLSANVVDGITPGVLWYNALVPWRKWEWQLLSQWSMKRNTPIGVAQLVRHWSWPTGMWQQLSLSGSVRTYHFRADDQLQYVLRYARYGLQLRARFRTHPQSLFVHRATATFWRLSEQAPTLDSTGAYMGKQWQRRPLWRVEWYTQRATLNSWSVEVGLEGSRLRYLGAEHRYGRMWAAMQYSYTYAPWRSIDLRFFIGGFFKNTAAGGGFLLPGAWNLSVQGFNDYGYEQLFVGRWQVQGIWSRQIALTEGAMKTALGPAYLQGRSNGLLWSLNLVAALPKDLPAGIVLKPWFDVGYYQRVGLFASDAWRDNLWWQGGVSLFDATLKVYLPLINAPRLEALYDQDGRQALWARISWALSLQHHDPWYARYRVLF